MFFFSKSYKKKWMNIFLFSFNVFIQNALIHFFVSNLGYYLKLDNVGGGAELCVCVFENVKEILYLSTTRNLKK